MFCVCSEGINLLCEDFIYCIDFPLAYLLRINIFHAFHIDIFDRFSVFCDKINYLKLKTWNIIVFSLSIFIDNPLCYNSLQLQ